MRQNQTGTGSVLVHYGLFTELFTQRPSGNENYSDSKVNGANMGPIWGRQDPGGPHVGPMNFAIWVPSLVMQFGCVHQGIRVAVMPLRWRHKSAVSAEITGNSNVCSTDRPGWHYQWTFVRAIHQWRCKSLTQWLTVCMRLTTKETPVSGMTSPVMHKNLHVMTSSSSWRTTEST